jgi:hypothetical protein
LEITKQDGVEKSNVGREVDLMCHASIQTTMNVSGRAMTDSKRKATRQVVGLVFGERWT